MAEHDKENNINEVFATLGKGGSCVYSCLEAINRLISVALQSNVPISTLSKQLKGIRCSSVHPTQGVQKGGPYLSCSDAIVRTLVERYEELTKPKGLQINFGEAEQHTAGEQQVVGRCKECGGPIIWESGCHRCGWCGLGKCG